MQDTGVTPSTAVISCQSAPFPIPHSHTRWSLRHTVITQSKLSIATEAPLNTARLPYSSARLIWSLRSAAACCLLHPNLHLFSIRVRHKSNSDNLCADSSYMSCISIVLLYTMSNMSLLLVLLLSPYGGFACLVPWFCITACMYKIQGTSPTRSPLNAKSNCIPFVAING